MKAILVAAAAAVAFVAGPLQAADLKSGGCLGCHDMEKKKVGPSFKDLSAKYAGKADAEAAIVAKLKEGKGHKKVNGSDDDIKSLVHEALSAK